MKNDYDIYNLAKFIFKLIEQGLSESTRAEIYFEKNKYISIDIEENSVKNSEVGEDHGLGIRVINKNGALGFAFSNKMEKTKVEEICKSALKMMKVSTPDPDFYDLPTSYQNYPK